jgi:hypothetical protein
MTEVLSNLPIDEVKIAPIHVSPSRVNHGALGLFLIAEHGKMDNRVSVDRLKVFHQLPDPDDLHDRSYDSDSTSHLSVDLGRDNISSESEDSDSTESEPEGNNGRPKRNRRAPSYLNDYLTDL